MKIKEIKLLLLFFAILGFTITGCKKEGSTSSFTQTELAQVQNSDVQDAIADKNDQDVDNSLDQLQVANYISANLKSAFVTGSRVITVDHPDSTTFPKVITIVYTNYQDSTANEKFVKNGEIDVTVTLAGADKQLVTRAQTFKNFSITTDSTTVTVKGTRTVTRTAHIHKFTGLTSLRLTTTDNITANLSYAITKTGVSDTLKFTRVVFKIRKAYLHYLNTGGVTWQTVKFKNIVATDTVTYSGTVTGVNEKGSSYSKTVSANTPLVITFYKGTPVISSGTIDFSITGTSAASFTITFMEDPLYPHFTLVTVTNNATLKSRSFDRRFSRKFTKWW